MFGQASNNYNALGPVHNLPEHQVSEVYSTYIHAAAKLDELSRTVDERESELGIKVRWTPESPEYKTTLAGLHLREYKQSLDRVEYLVVQRMFELSKLGMSGVGKLSHLPLYTLLLTAPRLQDAPEDRKRPSCSIGGHQESSQKLQPARSKPPPSS